MNRLYFGDNLDWLQNKNVFPDGCVDLVYLDPPFNSNANYNLLFKFPKPCRATAPVATPGTTAGGVPALQYPTRTNTGLEMRLSSVRVSSVVRYTAAFTPVNNFTPDANTVALYAFAEQTGLTAADTSGNGNDLTLTALPGGTLPVWFVE